MFLTSIFRVKQNMALLELKNIVKQFDDYLAVDDLTLNIEQGEFFTLLGPSGCGKTTLLRMIAGFLQPDSGQIILDGKDISLLPPEKRQLHTVFQNYALFPHMTVFDNIAFPLRMAKLPKDEVLQRVQELLDDVKLTRFAKRYPSELSGGQKQRVAIARALINRPKLLLLDEPLSALDAMLREHMQQELVKLQKDVGITFIYVTHDQSEALALSDRIAVLDKGLIQQLGKPVDLYSKPRSYFVADFIGKCNLLKAEVVAVSANDFTLKLLKPEINLVVDKENETDYSLQVGDTGYYALRPEKIKLRKMENITIDESMYKTLGFARNYYYYGQDTLYDISIANETKLEVLTPNNRATLGRFFDEDQQVQVLFDPNQGNFIPDDKE